MWPVWYQPWQDHHRGTDPALKGDYLAIATLAFGEIIRVILQNIDYVNGRLASSALPK
jgi:ABC-type branched-subunit amino acid transport system permease subunit